MEFEPYTGNGQIAQEGTQINTLFDQTHAVTNTIVSIFCLLYTDINPVLYIDSIIYPVNTKHLYNIHTMLDRRRRGRESRRPQSLARVSIEYRTS